MWTGALPSSPALQGWAYLQPSSRPGTVAWKRVRAAAIGPSEPTHTFLRSLAGLRWAPRGCYLVRYPVLSQVLPLQERQEEACIFILLLFLCFPWLLLLPVPTPGPRGGFLALLQAPQPRASGSLLQAPQPWASGSGETLCSQASVGSGKRVWLRNSHMPHRWIGGWGKGSLPCSPPHQHLPSPRVLSSSPGQVLPRESAGLTSSPSFWALHLLPPAGPLRCREDWRGGRAGQGLLLHELHHAHHNTCSGSHLQWQATGRMTRAEVNSPSVHKREGWHVG